MKPKLRSRARAAALQILYQMDLGTDEDEAYQHVMDHFGTPPLDSGYLRRLLDGVSSQREALAERLEQANPQWRQDRQDVVDRNLLLMSALSWSREPRRSKWSLRKPVCWLSVMARIVAPSLCAHARATC